MVPYEGEKDKDRHVYGNSTSEQGEIAVVDGEQHEAGQERQYVVGPFEVEERGYQLQRVCHRGKQYPELERDLSPEGGEYPEEKPGMALLDTVYEDGEE